MLLNRIFGFDTIAIRSLVRCEELIARLRGFVDDRGKIDWVTYYHVLHEEALCRIAADAAPRKAETVFDSYELRLAQASAKTEQVLLAARQKMMKLAERTSLDEGRFESMLVTMPTPPIMQGAFRNSSPKTLMLSSEVQSYVQRSLQLPF